MSAAEGFAAVPNWLVRDTAVPAQAKAVYMVLASHAGAQMTAYLTHATIAAESGWSVASVKRALAYLHGLGLIDWVHQRREDGGLRSNAYRIMAHAGQPPQGSESRGVAQGELPLRSGGTTPPLRVSEQEEEPLEEEPVEEGPRLRRGRGPAEEVADAVYEATGKGVTWPSVRDRARWALRERQVTPERVIEVMLALHNAGKPITQQLLAQVLDGIVKPGVAQGRPSGADILGDMNALEQRLAAGLTPQIGG